MVYLDIRRLYPTKNVNCLNHDLINSISSSILQNGYEIDKPIEVTEFDGFTFIADGHHRVCGAFKAGVMLLPVAYVSYMPVLNKSLCHDWEDLNRFKFEYYPGTLLSGNN